MIVIRLAQFAHGIEICSQQSENWYNSLSYVSYKDRKALAADLKKVYGAATETAAEQALVEFWERWDQQYPTISKSWLNHWQRVIPFFSFPADIRKAIYTTNAIESLNMTLRKVLKNH
jgi:putative transposase